MTMKSLFESLDAVRRLWSIYAAGPAPDDKQLARWMEQFSEDELTHAFRRVGKKFRDFDTQTGAMELLYRYATGVLVGEHQRQREMWSDNKITS